MCSRTAAQLAPTMAILFLKKTISSPINFVSLSVNAITTTNRKLHKSKDKFPFFNYFDGPEMRLDQAKISLVGHHDNPLFVNNF